MTQVWDYKGQWGLRQTGESYLAPASCAQEETWAQYCQTFQFCREAEHVGENLFLGENLVPSGSVSSLSCLILTAVATL